MSGLGVWYTEGLRLLYSFGSFLLLLERMGGFFGMLGMFTGVGVGNPGEGDCL